MRRIILLAVTLAVLQSHAADWQNVASEKGARVDIDRTSLLPSDPGKKIVWMRLVMTPEDAAREGYRTLKALNRYDCRANRYATIKRVYLREDMTVMREERVEGERESAVLAGTADAKLFREVCQPPTLGDLKKVALQAADAGQKASKIDGEAKKPLVDIRPSLRHADLKAEAEATRAAASLERVPDAKSPAHGEAKPPLKSEPTPAADKAEPPPRAVAPVHKPVPEARAPRAAAERHAPAPRAAAERHAPAPRAQLALAGHAVPAQAGKAIGTPAREARNGAHGDTHTGTGHDVHWTYDGDTGPDNWGKLKPEWKTCSTGERQSPIDIRDGIRVDQEAVRFYYKPSGFRVIDNGHTVQANLTGGNRIQALGREFELVQLHFHRPSEERVNGKLYEMVAHLVHKDKEGRLAVVAVLLDKGADNPVIQTLWNHLPLERNIEYPASVALDVDGLLPEDRSYFSYMGSLTTPPCSEGVLWIVLRTPAAVSAEQVAAFSRLYPNNARPIQQAAGRLIKESR